MTRPTVQTRAYAWRGKDRNETPGIALWQRGRGLVAHLTCPEGRTLADRLHDLCDANGDPEAPLPTTESM